MNVGYVGRGAAMFGLIIISSVIQILVTIHVFRKGRSNTSYLLFFFLSIVSWIWAVLNYVSITELDSIYLTSVVRFIMFFAVLQVFLFYLFANAFPQGTSSQPIKELASFGILTSVILGVTLTPLMFKSVLVFDGVANIQTGWGLYVFAAYTLFYISRAIRTLLRKFHRAKGLKRQQLFILLVAAFVHWVFVPLTNFVFTLMFNTTLFVMFAPMYTLIFSGIIGYALIKHRLFDAGTILRGSVIYVNNYIRHRKWRSVQYYELKTLIETADSNHIALDFSGVKNLDDEAINILHTLRAYEMIQGRNIYFVGYTQKVFNQLRSAELHTKAV